jgi:predicted metal-dependent hydrolase
VADLIDYVLVHELAHIRHPDHGAAFWRTVDRAMPGWEDRRARLKQAGAELWLPSLWSYSDR